MLGRLNPSHTPRLLLALLMSAFGSATVHAQVLYSDDFNTDTSANYTITSTLTSTSTPSSDATFAYNYGAAPASGGLAIPAAPHTTDGSTIGLRLRTDNLGTTSQPGIVLGAITVATKNLILPAQYTVTADVWGNYIGSGTSIATSGSNGTTGAAMGLGTVGTGLQSPNGNDGFLAGAIHDNGSSSTTYRAYVYGTNSAAATGYYAAGSQNNTNAYYTAFLPSQTAPAAQQSFSATQGGSTPTGIISFAWHAFTLTQDGTNVTWYIDGNLIATVPDSAFTSGFGGSQVSLDAFDTGVTGNSAANNQLFNADIWDNLTVIAVPEPGSMCLAGLAAGAGLWFRRKRRPV